MRKCRNIQDKCSLHHNPYWMSTTSPSMHYGRDCTRGCGRRNLHRPRKATCKSPFPPPRLRHRYSRHDTPLQTCTGLRHLPIPLEFLCTWMYPTLSRNSQIHSLCCSSTRRLWRGARAPGSWWRPPCSLWSPVARGVWAACHAATWHMKDHTQPTPPTCPAPAPRLISLALALRKLTHTHVCVCARTHPNEGTLTPSHTHSRAHTQVHLHTHAHTHRSSPQAARARSSAQDQCQVTQPAQGRVRVHQEPRHAHASRARLPRMCPPARSRC